MGTDGYYITGKKTSNKFTVLQLDTADQDKVPGEVTRMIAEVSAAPAVTAVENRE